MSLGLKPWRLVAFLVLAVVAVALAVVFYRPIQLLISHGDAASEVRQHYGQQKAGISSSSSPAPALARNRPQPQSSGAPQKKLIPLTRTDQLDFSEDVNPAKESAARSDNNFSKSPSLPGVKEDQQARSNSWQDAMSPPPPKDKTPPVPESLLLPTLPENPSPATGPGGFYGIADRPAPISFQ